MVPVSKWAEKEELIIHGGGPGPAPQAGWLGLSAIARPQLLGGHHFVLELVLSADVVVGYAEYEVRGRSVGVLARPLGGPLRVRRNRVS